MDRIQTTRRVRDATPDDAAACAAIYAPYVTDTAVTFEADPPDAPEMARRIAAAATTHAWLVLEDDGALVGYALEDVGSAGPSPPRAAAQSLRTCTLPRCTILVGAGGLFCASQV